MVSHARLIKVTMNPKELQNNNELFEYLAQLAKYLKNGGHPELAKAVNQAMQFASGSSSEFMHEAYLVPDRKPRFLKNRHYPLTVFSALFVFFRVTCGQDSQLRCVIEMGSHLR